MPEGFVLKVGAIRGKLVQRVARAAFPDSYDSVNDDTRRAIGAIRVGNYSSIPWLALIGCKDGGSADDPLKGMNGIDPREAATRVDKMGKTLGLILMYASPMTAAVAAPFFNSLLENVASCYRELVPSDVISKYLAMILRKVSKRTKGYFLGDPDGEPTPEFDSAWIDDPRSPEAKALARARHKAAAKSFHDAREIGPRDRRDRRGRDRRDDDGSKDTKRQKVRIAVASRHSTAPNPKP